MYVVEIDKIEIPDIPAKYKKLKRIGLTFISKTDLIQEVKEFFPSYMNTFSKWWDNMNLDTQFKVGETFVHFNEKD
jgi:Ni2+-binding GTPase involved in maturation of urease and hydrogenase